MEIIVLLLFVLLFTIPFLLSFIIYKFVKNLKHCKFLKFLAAVPILLFVYFIYDAVYPGAEFYEEDYMEVTGMRFPDHSEIISKSASYPDTHGDYTSAAALKMSSKEYITLLDKMKLSTFKNEPYNTSSPQLSIVERDVKAVKYKAEYVKQIDDKEYFVGFLSDNTVIFCRASW